MPTLINYRACSADSALFYSNGSNVDVYGPSRKRARISSLFGFDGYLFEKKKSSIEILPDECLFEIFRHLPGGQERSATACVSKHWLMLLSSIRNSEIYDGKSTQTEQEVCKAIQDIEMISADETKEDSCDGYLTRCIEGKKATDVRLVAIAVGTATRWGLGKLSIRGSNCARGVTDLGLSAIAHGCPSLRVLSLWNVLFTGDEGLLKIAKECHLLEKLDLCECPSVSIKDAELDGSFVEMDSLDYKILVFGSRSRIAHDRARVLMSVMKLDMYSESCALENGGLFNMNS